jgi:hypothetical protein
MSNCIACGNSEPFPRGVNTAGGWWCSRCSGVGTLNTGINNAQGRTLADFPAVELMGLLGTVNFSREEKTAILRAGSSPQHDEGGEDIWGLGIAAHHQTSPGVNIVVVFTRAHGVCRVYGIGRHIGRGNDKYRILSWDGRSRRVRRT